MGEFKWVMRVEAKRSSRRRIGSGQHLVMEVGPRRVSGLSDGSDLDAEPDPLAGAKSGGKTGEMGVAREDAPSVINDDLISIPSGQRDLANDAGGSGINRAAQRRSEVNAFMGSTITDPESRRQAGLIRRRACQRHTIDDDHGRKIHHLPLGGDDRRIGKLRVAGEQVQVRLKRPLRAQLFQLHS